MNSRAVKVKAAHSFGVRCEKSGARLSLAAFFRCQRRPCHFIVVERSLRQVGVGGWERLTRSPSRRAQGWRRAPRLVPETRRYHVHG